ncbi:MAG: trypsin-like peptidase domain-containing protein [Porticoccaceae bacterium]|nr:trypsin-like peptidase domain-containing protein [Pseudomonadales bacterium]MCP5172586.1 trypsin-like peptidase domain-containing protein [Pseudomonadales bacterium]MCP5303502.1 trypsin-like peptidase domain-containing protein [Pseudomonadales bacterium]
MSYLLRFIRYIGWPTISGLLAAAVVLLLFPQLLENNRDQVVTDELAPDGASWTGPISYSEAVRRAAPSVVNIYTQKEITRARHPLLDDPFFRRFFNSSNLPQQKRMQSSLGSGVILGKEGYVLTNNHVVAGADQIIALLHDGREAKALVVGNDPETDLAVIKIEADNLTPISIGDPSQAKVGDVVLAIGNPFGVGQSVSQGIISATGRNGLGLNTFENFIQTDAAINPGNSGGALVDAFGNLLGINSAILDRTGYSVGIGFAIPADTAIKILEDIVQYGRVIRGWLGVEARPLSQQMAQRLGLNPPQGLLITNIQGNSPAQLAGIQPGDIITRINNRWAGDNNRSMSLIAQLSPGDPVQLEVWRDGEEINVMAVAGTRPTPN